VSVRGALKKLFPWRIIVSEPSQKPIAVFDIDGTLIRSSLLIELVHALVAEGIFPKIANSYIRKARLAWVNRVGTYHDYLVDVIQQYERRLVGCNVEDVRYVGQRVATEQRDQVYTFTRDLINELSETHFLVAITGSPSEVVDPFLRLWGFHRWHATSFSEECGRYTSDRVLAPAIAKEEVLDEELEHSDVILEGSVGIGDTSSDIPFLRRVDRAIAFNPNRDLRSAAAEHRWEIVVERKDSILQLVPEGNMGHTINFL
jgi:HAD superfamily phosphoserine phosphatase-like hydrolase